MANTGNKIARLVAVLVAALIGVAIGTVLLWVVKEGYVNTAIWVMFIVLGILTVISTLPGFITAIKNVKQKYGVLNIVLTSISLVLGIVMIFEQKYIPWIAAIYLLVFPIIRIVLAKDHFAQTRNEAPLLILGIVVLLLGVGGATSLIFTVTGWVIIALSAIYAIFGAIASFRN